jgi:hypothetical protein
LVTEEKLSIVRACNAVSLSRSAYYRPRIDWQNRDADVIAVLNALMKWGRSRVI